MQCPGAPQYLPSSLEPGWSTVLGSEDPMTSSVGVACQWGLQPERPLWALV